MKKQGLFSIFLTVCTLLVACSMLLAGCTVEKHKHDYDKWEITRKPTCTEGGEKVRSCDCGETQTRKVSATGKHTYDENVVCTVCGLRPEYTLELLYKVNDDGTGISIIGLDEGAPSDVVIPDEIDGLPVTSIKLWAFENCTSLTSIVIPAGVTVVEKWAFEGCESLSAVYYKGSKSDWDNTLLYYSDELYYTMLHYYSESEPTLEGNFWHYVDGKPTA